MCLRGQRSAAKSVEGALRVPHWGIPAMGWFWTKGLENALSAGAERINRLQSVRMGAGKRMAHESIAAPAHLQA